VIRATSIEPDKTGNFYIAVAELRCQGLRRAGVAVMDTNGQLHKNFGNSGTKVFSGPNGEELIPVGGIPKSYFLFDPFNDDVWLGAAVGDGCDSGGENDCTIGLTRFDLHSGDLNETGWVLVDGVEAIDPENTVAGLQPSTGLRPYDMAVDGQGKPVLVGTAWVSGSRGYFVTRFTKNGQMDNTFGTSGWTAAWFKDLEGGARAVQPLVNGGIAVAIKMVVDQIFWNDINSVGMLSLDSNGIIEWEHSPWAADTLVTHYQPSKLNYGHFSEKDIANAAVAITEDWNNRITFVGWAASTDILNPCQQAGLGLELLVAFSGSCGGPNSIMLGRYLPFGEPDSRRWIMGDEKRRIILPEDRTFDVVPPSLLNITLEVVDDEIDGYNDIEITRTLTPYQNTVADAETNSFGSYRFPLAPFNLKDEERFYIKTHTLDHHHRNAAGNRFAYDITMMRWDDNTGEYTSLVENPLPGASANELKLIWDRPVRAISSGTVLNCRRDAKDNSPTFTGTKGNYVTIQHAFDAADASKAELLTYMHFRQSSIPESVCPYICPTGKPGCDLDTEGVDPDGADISWKNIKIDADEEIGRVGNSGNSTGPHLHFHMVTGAGAVKKSPDPGSYPLLFHGVKLESYDFEPGTGPSFNVNDSAIVHGSMARPTE
jgi:hypothetical protein